MSFKVNKESGFPSGYDYYSDGSENTVKNMIPTPAGFNTMTDSAIINMHQDSSETAPIGVPGTSYTPHSSDNIWRTEGGHLLIFGNAPGSETLRVQSKSGATIELDHEGAIKIVSGKGLHMSIGGDNQVVLQGDFSLATNGNFKVKAAHVYYDCTDFHVNATGSMLFNVHGDYNLNCFADAHTAVAGDNSLTVGGSQRETIGGNKGVQVTGSMSYSAKATARFASIGDMTIDTKAKMNTTSTGDMTTSAKANMLTQADGTMNVKAKGAMTVASQADMKTTAKGTMTVASDGNTSIGSASTTIFGGDGDIWLGGTGSTRIAGTTVEVNGTANLASPPWVDGGAAIPHQAPARDAATTNVPDVQIEVPDLEEVLDTVSDFVATDGEIVKITSMQQLAEKYNLEEDGELPEKVKQRAQELGLDVDKTPREDSLIQSAEQNASLKNNIALLNDGSSFHPDIG